MTTIESAPPIGAATVVPLWPEGAPGSEARRDEPEIFEPADEQLSARVRNVHHPSLTVYLAPPELATGAAAIVAPGGGHRYLAIEHEGHNVAEYLNTLGVSAFVLKYRLSREDGSPYQLETHSLADAQRAVRLVRARAAEWGVDPARVLMMGFSAGAGVTLLAATHHDAGRPGAADPVEQQGCRPDAQALIYGPGPFFRLDQITLGPETPPAFLLGTDDDQIISESFPRLYAALKAAGVPTELHVYASGGHGFGIRKEPKPVPSASTWQHRLGDWLRDRGMLARS